jgi:hypothetical protein
MRINPSTIAEIPTSPVMQPDLAHRVTHKLDVIIHLLKEIMTGLFL